MAQATILLDKVSKQFNHELLFRNISARFCQGTSYAIQGVSGTGKSTLLSLIGNLDNPTFGTVSIIYDAESSLDFQLQKRAGSTTEFLFQQPYLIKELSIIENIQLPGIIKGQKKEHCNQRARILLEKINLSHKAKAYPNQLSGGQLTRVALARALFNEPLFLIADEPTASLDAHAAREIILLLQKFQRELPMGLIIATHDSVVAHMLDERYALYEQTLIKQQ